MNLQTILKRSVKRGYEDWLSGGILQHVVRFEAKYVARQARAAALQHLHVFVENRVTNETRDDHAMHDYLDPPDHIVIACYCGKEFN